MKTDPRFDAYISKAAPFAQPILIHLRSLVHRTCPEAEEAIKWRMPMFTFQGKLFCAIAAFKEHCRFIIFGPEVRALIRKGGHGSSDEPGAFDKLKSLAGLPGDRELARYLRFGAGQVARGKSPMARGKGKPKPAPKLPADFAAGLKRMKKAQAEFGALSPSARREYIEWVVGAKRDETRARRLAQAIAWIAEGKKLNWRYET